MNKDEPEYFTINNLTKEYLKNNIGLVTIVILTSFFMLVKGLIFPTYLGELIPAIKSNSKDVYHKLISTIIVFLLFNVGIGVHDYFKMCLKQTTQPFYINLFSQNILDNLEREFIKTPESVLYSNIVLFSDREDWYYENIIRGILPLVLIILGINGYLYYYDLNSGIIFTITIIIYIFVSIKIQNKVIKESKVMTAERDNVIKYSEDINKNIDSILSFGKIEEEKENIGIITNKYGLKLWNWMNSDYLSRQVTIIIFSVSFLIIIYRLYSLWNNKQIEGQVFISFIIIIFYFMNGDLPKCAERIQSITQQYGQKQNYLNKINGFLNKSINKNKINKTLLEKNDCQKCLISINNINYTYTNGRNIFLNFNLKIYKGETIALIGNNGCGKSTLLKLLFGMNRIQKGSIYYNDTIELNNTNIRLWRDNIHYIPQYPKLFNRTVEDNINYANSNKQHLNQLLTELGISDIILPLINRKVGLGGERLSGGQRQIISLFRVIANPKTIILLDEPTSALDKRSKEIVYKMLDYLKKNNTTIILVTHDMELIKKCNRRINLSNGRIIEDSLTTK